MLLMNTPDDEGHLQAAVSLLSLWYTVADLDRRIGRLFRMERNTTMISLWACECTRSAMRRRRSRASSGTERCCDGRRRPGLSLRRRVRAREHLGRLCVLLSYSLVVQV